MIDFKKELLKIGAGLLFSLSIGLFVWWKHFDTFELITFLCGLNLCFVLGLHFWKTFRYKEYQVTPNSLVKNIVKNWLIIVCLVVSFHFLSGFLGGFTGFITTCFLSAGFIIAMRWKKYIEVKHQIETMLFGEPLHNFRKRGEKPPKIEIK